MLMNFCDVKLYRRKNKPISFLLLISSKDPDTGKDWGQAEKRAIEDEMAGWHPWFNGHEFEQTPEDGEGQGSVTSYSSWGCKESDHTEWLNNNKFISDSLWPCGCLPPGSCNHGNFPGKNTGVGCHFLLQLRRCLVPAMSPFVTPWTAACQASLSYTIFQSLLKLMSTELMMPSNHLILQYPLLLLPSIFPGINGEGMDLKSA